MVKEINKDLNSLSQKSLPVNLKEHRQVITDLLDTAKAHKEDCLGLAAIQINCPIKCFVMKDLSSKSQSFITIINPTIIKRSNETYSTEEGCLSLEGKKLVKRCSWINVVYTDINNKVHSAHLTGLQGEVFQHEYDHLMGKLI